MRPPTVGAIGRELSSTSTAHNWVRDGGWPRGWPPWESQAWEADTLPAELLPLGATGVIADRARGANGNPAASALRSLEWLRRYGTLAPHRPGAENSSPATAPLALAVARNAKKWPRAKRILRLANGGQQPIDLISPVCAGDVPGLIAGDRATRRPRIPQPKRLRPSQPADSPIRSVLVRAEFCKWRRWRSWRRSR